MKGDDLFPDVLKRSRENNRRERSRSPDRDEDRDFGRDRRGGRDGDRKDIFGRTIRDWDHETAQFGDRLGDGPRDSYRGDRSRGRDYRRRDRSSSRERRGEYEEDGRRSRGFRSDNYDRDDRFSNRPKQGAMGKKWVKGEMLDELKPENYTEVQNEDSLKEKDDFASRLSGVKQANDGGNAGRHRGRRRAQDLF